MGCGFLPFGKDQKATGRGKRKTKSWRKKEARAKGRKEGREEERREVGEPDSKWLQYSIVTNY